MRNSTIKPKPIGNCAYSKCGKPFPKQNSFQKCCSFSHTRLYDLERGKEPKTPLSSPIMRKEVKPIPKQSEKKKKEIAKYLKVRSEFMNQPENKVCPITGQLTTDVHHRAGRVGYFDDWARENEIPLLIDIRHFIAVSRKGHQQIENNPTWAKEMGFSVDRLAKN